MQLMFIIILELFIRKWDYIKQLKSYIVYVFKLEKASKITAI